MKRWQKVDALLVIVLALVTILSRLPFHSSLLNSHDAVNYALGLDHFDMRLHQPQPPGYPLYILLGRLFCVVLGDHLTALVWLSTIASGLATSAMYLAGREMFGRSAGAIAALLLATSGPIWHQGEVAAPYSSDLFASVMVGWLCYRASTSAKRSAVWVSALALGLAGALRLQTLVFLFPLFVYALRKRSWKTILGAIAGGGFVFGLFFVPAVVASGGPAAFLLSMRKTVPILWSAETMVRSAKWRRYLRNGVTITQYTIRVVGEMALLSAAVGYLTRPCRLRFWRSSRLVFLLLWFVPTWIVFLVIWPGNTGTILVCTPPFFVLSAIGIEWVMERPRWGRIAGWAVLIILMVWRIGVFTVLPEYPLGESYRKFATYRDMQRADAYFQSKQTLIRQLPVEGTIVYANAFRHFQYYLPEYRAYSLPTLSRSDPTLVKSIIATQNGLVEAWEKVDVGTLVPPDTERIVWFDLPSDILLIDLSLVEERTENGYTIQILSVPPNAKALWTQEGLSLDRNE